MQEGGEGRRQERKEEEKLGERRGCLEGGFKGRPEASELGTWGTATHCTAFGKTRSHWRPYP